MIIAAALLSALFYAGGLWVYIFLPRWARFDDSDATMVWYGFGWMVTLGAATIPTALLWNHI